MSKWNKTVVACTTSILAFSALAACTGKTDQGASEEGAADPKSVKPVEISIMTTFYSPEPPDENNSISKEIEKRTNTKLKFSWLSPNNYEEKMNVTLSSGDMPDLMLVSDPFAPVIRKAAAQGAFWDVTELYSKYPKLAEFPKDSWELTKMEDGKNYGIPRVRPTEGGGFPYVRKDWLDKLGIPVPQTIDEVYKVWKAFVENDPDGNGKADTIGYAAYVAQDGMGSIGWVESAFNGTNGSWKLVNGKLVNINILPETKDSLIFLNKAYMEKLIPEDFAILKATQAKDMMKASKSGMGSDTPEAAWEPTQELRKTNPKADVLPLASINGFTNKDTGFNGMYVINKKVPEAKLKKIMEMLDYGATDEAWDLVSFGLKDTHYTEKDGNKVFTELGQKELVTQGAFKQLLYKNDKYQRAFRNGMPNDYLERNKKVIDERAKVSQSNLSVGLYSETALTVGPEINKKIQDMKTKIIYGKEPITAWDEFVKKLQMEADFQKMTKELNDSYQKRVGGKK
ncbi:extracellular solute-binding protein [Paenibacillus sp. LMG 31456]|uniref:Extracellular solute-binding protein n=1 Tax=Paenibacillus foliorum TaxID=2654974 RepID=A0A972GWD3_9BACL|nr:extracellular solute-binding protein [Paenibacillus foliorum]NOU98134.1 extracellular solute-binding protein [Paenibacillus foliorum]